MCSFPSSDFDLSYSSLPALTQGHSYAIAVDFTIPDSPSNQASGMMLLTLELFDAEGNRTILFRTSFSVPYRSTVVRLASRLIFLPLHVTGVISEELQFSVPLSADFRDLQHQPSTRGRVTLESRGLTWSAVSIRFKAALNGLSKFLYYWPWTTFIAVTLFLFCVINCLYAILLACNTARSFFQTAPEGHFSLDRAQRNSLGGILASLDSVYSREGSPPDRSTDEITDVADRPP